MSLVSKFLKSSLIFILAIASLAYFYSYFEVFKLNFGLIDFVQYWSSAKLFLYQQNPYDVANLRMVQSTTGINYTVLIWNPPFVFCFISLLGLFNYHLAAAFWFACGVLCLAFSYSKFVTNIFDWRSLLFLISFYPAFLGLYYGQITWILLLAITLFIYFFEKEKFYCAGVALSLSIVKPHLFLIFYLGILIRAIFELKQNNKNFQKTILGVLICGVIFLLFPLYFQPQIYNYYLGAYQLPPTYWFTSSLGSFVSMLSPENALFMRFVPCILTALGLACYCFRYKKNLEFNTLLALSILVSPYGWEYDYVVLLPFLLRAVQRNSNWPIVINFLTAISVLFIKEMQYSIWYLVVCLVMFAVNNHTKSQKDVVIK